MMPTFVSELNDPANALGSNLLKVTIGLAALIFIVVLQSHHNYDQDSPHSGIAAMPRS